VSISREIGSRLVRVVERAREAALFFAPSSSARRVSLVASWLSLSLLLTFSCFVAPNLLHISFVSLVHHFFVVEGGEERLIFGRWAIVFLIPMLESSSRSLSANVALRIHALVFKAWCSTLSEVSCSPAKASTIKFKYSHAMMARSCLSLGREEINQASSRSRMALRSITIMIASSSLTVSIIEYSYGH